MNEKIAIVGIGCRFPGGIDGPEEFWRALTEGRDAIGTIPPDRMDLAALSPESGEKDPLITTLFGGYLDDIDKLDAEFFGLSPREAERLDPQQRLLMETSWEALEDAGVDTAELEGSATGVFVGQWTSDFEARMFADPERTDFLMTTGSGRYAASGRLSYLLGLNGPSFTIDTACSSSLAAIQIAMRSLQNGDCSMALAGGVNVILQPHVTIAYSASAMMAKDGRCKFGSAEADGYVRSEGAGIVVLKRLEDALADGDRIYATILGGAINNDGRASGSMGTPSREGQEDLLRKAWADAGADPARADYVEAHGTGTRVGDPVELGALGAVLGAGRDGGKPLKVGSVKTNFGHTEGAAGAAGLIKAALALHAGKVPQSLHCATPNPTIPWDGIGCEIARESTALPSDALAGASAFGIAGTNAHIVLGSAPKVATTADAETTASIAILPLSARNETALRALTGRYAALLSGVDAPALAALCRNAALRRTALSHRVVFVADSASAMIEKLTTYAEGGPADAEGVAPDTAASVGFVAPGQGGQWPGMARMLLASEPVFADAIARCDAALAGLTDWTLASQIAAETGDADYLMDRIDVIQPMLVALAIAYADLLRSKGIEPVGVVGHSMGEVASAAIAGVLDTKTAMRLICRRSALMREKSGQGAMGLVELPFADAQARLAGFEDKLAVGASNSPRASVLSGDPEALEALMAQLESEGVFTRRINVDVASHSPQMAEAAERLAAEFAELAPQGARLPIYSTVLAERAEGNLFGAAYWARNLREPVRFAQTVEAMQADGITAFAELGPHPALTGSITQTLPDSKVAACGRREVDDRVAFLTALGALWTAGAALDWRAVMPGDADFVRLPGYPWQRERYWVAEAELQPLGSHGPRQNGKLDEEQQGWLHRLIWEPLADITETTSRDWLVIGNERAKALADALATGGTFSHADRAKAWAEGTRNIAVLGNGDPYLPVAIARELADSANPPKLWFITEGAQSVSGEAADAAGAALWGAARVVGEERPELLGGLIDVDALESAAKQVAARLNAADGEDQIAVRAGKAHALRIVAAADTASAPFPWRKDASYLITGGLGAIGLRLAEVMVESGASRIVLMGRTALPPRSQWSSNDLPEARAHKIAAIRALEAKGASIHLASVDVSDEQTLGTWLSEYAAEGWPPIRGVVHAAGSFDNRLIADMDEQAFTANLSAKLGGAQLLDRLLPDLDLFVLISSTGSFLPQPGQTNYAAANAGLQAIAARRRASGKQGLAIAWGVWEGTGLVADAQGAVNVAEMARQGYGSFSLARGGEVFAQIAGLGDANIIVVNMDWDKYAASRPGRGRALFAELASDGADASAEDLSALPTAERKKRLEQLVREAVGQVLKIAPARVDARKSFGSMGLNSLLAMEFRNRLEKALARPLSATLAWNYPSIDALTEHLAGDDAPAATTPPLDIAQPEADTLADEVDSLSDEDAMLALMSRPKGRRR